MKALKFKDIKYRQFYLKNEKKSIYNKFLFIHLLNKVTDTSTNGFPKYLFLLLKSKKFSKLKYKSKTKMVRRCVTSLRSRSATRPYGLSRFFMREYIQFGLLPGYKKAVW